MPLRSCLDSEEIHVWPHAASTAETWGGTHTTGGRLNTKKVRIKVAAKNAIRTLDPFVCITRCPASRQVADVWLDFCWDVFKMDFTALKPVLQCIHTLQWQDNGAPTRWYWWITNMVIHQWEIHSTPPLVETIARGTTSTDYGVCRSVYLSS